MDEIIGEMEETANNTKCAWLVERYSMSTPWNAYSNMYMELRKDIDLTQKPCFMAQTLDETGGVYAF